MLTAEQTVRASAATEVPRAARLVVALAALLVMGRSLVFLLFEHSLFDSDQAIVGLMAKHLAEGRAFPLFYYGQQYALAVEAWLAALLFVVFGASVFTLHLTITLIHLVVVSSIVVALVRAGVDRWAALVSVLFFALAPRASASLLSEANGVNVEPYLFVAWLWWVRDRPLWSGAVLGIGILSREFTAYAVPALAVAHLLEGRIVRGELARWWLLAAVACGAVFALSDLVQPYSDFMGPGTSGLVRPGIGPSVTDRTAIVLSELPHRARVLLGEGFAQLLGSPPAAAEATGSAAASWLARLVGIATALAVVRVLWLSIGWDRRSRAKAAPAVYLACVGLASLAGYVLTRPATPLTLRYVLLGLLVPVGVTALLLAFEPWRPVRRALVLLVLLWAVVSASGHVQLLAHFASGRERDFTRELVDELTRRKVDIAASGYWRAYKVSFLSGERVKVASDFVRIKEYQDLAAAAGNRLRSIEEMPCPGGEPVATYFLCR